MNYFLVQRYQLVNYEFLVPDLSQRRPGDAGVFVRVGVSGVCVLRHGRRRTAESPRMRGLRPTTFHSADPQGLHRTAVRHPTGQSHRISQGLLSQNGAGESGKKSILSVIISAH